MDIKNKIEENKLQTQTLFKIINKKNTINMSNPHAQLKNIATKYVYFKSNKLTSTK
jgi:hypothetical protein